MKNSMRFACGLVALALVLLPAWAFAAPKHPRRGGSPPPAPAPSIHWDHGYWHHGWYGGRMGWWWVVGPSWHYYEYPFYPYWGSYSSRVVVVEQPAPTGPPPTAYWYWCDEPKGYYPYVAQCAGGWTPVPATPPDLQKPKR